VDQQEEVEVEVEVVVVVMDSNRVHRSFCSWPGPRIDLNNEHSSKIGTCGGFADRHTLLEVVKVQEAVAEAVAEVEVQEAVAVAEAEVEDSHKSHTSWRRIFS
jgi:hypothetical protein